MHLSDGWSRLLAFRDAAVAQGAKPVGWKVAWNHESARRRLGVDGPAVGVLFDNAVFPVGTPLSLDGSVLPGLEVEVAARVDSGGGVVEVAPAVEVLDVTTPSDDPVAALGANVWHRAAVIDGWRPVPDGFAVPDISWVPGVLAGFGERLREGDVVLTGSLDPRLRWVHPGDVVEAAVPGLGGFLVEFV